MECQKVIGHELVRDPETNSIINPNKEEFEQFKLKKMESKKLEERLCNLETQLVHFQEIVKKYESLMCTLSDRCNIN